MSPFVQTLLRSLQVPEAEPVDAGGFEAGVLVGVEPPALPDPLSGVLAGGEFAGGFAGAGFAGAGLDADLAEGSHLPPAQIEAQSRS